MNKITLKKITALLLNEKKQLLKQSNLNLDIDVDGDETDEVQGNMLIEMNNQLNNRNLLKLQQIESALKKIEDKTYGVCEDCEESIPEKRLLLNPCFQTCVGCAEDRELEEKRKGI